MLSSVASVIVSQVLEGDSAVNVRRFTGVIPECSVKVNSAHTVHLLLFLLCVISLFLFSPSDQSVTATLWGPRLLSVTA